MKIAIINLGVDTNYGGSLQRYALCKCLTGLGHQPIFIPTHFYVKVPHGVKAILLYIKRIILKYILRRDNTLTVLFEKKCKIDEDINMPVFYEFFRRNVPYYNRIFESLDCLKELNNDNFDAFLVGSDQVWRASTNTHYYFLDFVKKGKKIAYAASFGNAAEDYTQEMINRIRLLVSKFDAVSVREKKAIDIFRRFNWTLSYTPECVLDPTLLLDKDDYLKILNQSSLKKNNDRNLFYYILDFDSQKKSFVERFSYNKGLSYHGLNSLHPYLEFSDTNPLPSVEQWISYIRDAEYVITDSFHGTMFSIIFNKPFITLLNSKRGSERYNPIMNQLGLEDRLVADNQLDQLSDVDFPAINWKFVNDRLSQLREKSFMWLKQNIV